MPKINFTDKEKIAMVKQVIKNRDGGKKTSLLAIEFGVSRPSLDRWVREYMAGKMKDDESEEQEELSGELLEAIKEEFDPEDKKMIDVIICTKTGKGEIVTKIEDPGIFSEKEQKTEIKRRLRADLKILIAYSF